MIVEKVLGDASQQKHQKLGYRACVVWCNQHTGMRSYYFNFDALKCQKLVVYSENRLLHRKALWPPARALNMATYLVIILQSTQLNGTILMLYHLHQSLPCTLSFIQSSILGLLHRCPVVRSLKSALPPPNQHIASRTTPHTRSQLSQLLDRCETILTSTWHILAFTDPCATCNSFSSCEKPSQASP